jgi:hypothetical protein
MEERMTGTPPTAAPIPALGGQHTPSAAETPSRPASAGTVEDAKSRASDVASTARDKSAEVASEAKDQAGEVFQEAKSQARNVVEDLKRDAHDQASAQTGRAAEGLRGLAQQLGSLVDGRPGDAGIAGDCARRLGDRVSDIAERVERGGFDGVVQDMRRYARRRAGTFLLGAAVAGFATGRLLRVGAQAEQGNGTPSPGVTTSPLPAGARTVALEPGLPVEGPLTAGAPPVGTVPVSPALEGFASRTDC